MKTAAIWARVSTQDQRELSLDGQVERVKAKLEGLGYLVPPERILKVDWGSLDLHACPPFQELRRSVKAREINGLGVLDRDRLNAQGLQRLNFLADCKDAGVEVIPYQGPPILDGPEGQLVELAIAMGKERSVERAQQGARDGLRDRARLKRLPPVPKNPYGYIWDAQRKALLPTADWENARLICRWALAGWTLHRIRQELHSRVILSPTGKPWWWRRSIHVILTNPIYGGRYYALKVEKVVPRHRKGETYGKTSSRRRSLEEALYLPDITVQHPPLTWEEWLAVQERFKLNKLQASRNAKWDYLLRGLITCEVHHCRYAGHNGGQYWQYRCYRHQEMGQGPCPRPNLNGRELEEKVKDVCRDILTKPELIEAEIAKCTGRTQETLQSIARKLAALGTKEAKALDTETNLVMRRASGDASPEAYERALALVRAQRRWVAEERQRLQAELEAAQKREGMVLGLREARERLLTFLERGTVQDWREVLNALGVKVSVGEDGVVQVSLAIPVAEASIVSSTPGRGSPGCGCSRQSPASPSARLCLPPEPASTPGMPGQVSSPCPGPRI